MSKTQSGFSGRCKLFDNALELLSSAIRPGSRVLEIGTLDGVTASLLARRQPDAAIFSVDVFRSVSPAGWMKNRQRNQALIVGTSKTVLRLARHGQFDVIFVEGDHSHRGVLADLRASAQLLAPGGRIFCHDWGTENWPGVTTAVTEFLADHHAWTTGRRAGSLLELLRAEDAAE